MLGGWFVHGHACGTVVWHPRITDSVPLTRCAYKRCSAVCVCHRYSTASSGVSMDCNRNPSDASAVPGGRHGARFCVLTALVLWPTPVVWKPESDAWAWSAPSFSWSMSRSAACTNLCANASCSMRNSSSFFTSPDERHMSSKAKRVHMEAFDRGARADILLMST